MYYTCTACMPLPPPPPQSISTISSHPRSVCKVCLLRGGDSLQESDYIYQEQATPQLLRQREFKMESTSKLSNFNCQWTKTLF